LRCIAIGGGISGQGEYLLNKIIPQIQNGIYGKGNIKKGVVKIAQLGNNAGLIGAGLLYKTTQEYIF